MSVYSRLPHLRRSSGVQFPAARRHVPRKHPLTTHPPTKYYYYTRGGFFFLGSAFVGSYRECGNEIDAWYIKGETKRCRRPGIIIILFHRISHAFAIDSVRSDECIDFTIITLCYGVFFPYYDQTFG